METARLPQEFSKDRPQVIHYDRPERWKTASEFRFLGSAQKLQRYRSDWTVKTPEVRTVPTPNELRYEVLKSRIEDLCSCFTEDGPNRQVMAIAIRALQICKEANMFPSLINVTGDESILFEFFFNGNRFAIDFYNSGDIVFLQRKFNEIPSVADIAPGELKAIISTIALSYAPTVESV